MNVPTNAANTLNARGIGLGVKLQKYDAKLNAYNRFVQDWFEIAKQNGNVKVDGGVNFKEIEERIASINATIETLINKIK